MLDRTTYIFVDPEECFCIFHTNFHILLTARGWSYRQRCARLASSPPPPTAWQGQGCKATECSLCFIPLLQYGKDTNMLMHAFSSKGRPKIFKGGQNFFSEQGRNGNRAAAVTGPQRHLAALGLGDAAFIYYVLYFYTFKYIHVAFCTFKLFYQRGAF